MANIPTQMTALMCCYQMHRRGFNPAAIINAGVSSAPESLIWQWIWPDVPVVGIDPRRKRRWWKWRYEQAVLGDGSAATYCGACHSIQCRNPGSHLASHHRPKAVTIDEISVSLPGPQFLWMDIDGGEVIALRGAEKSFRRIWWINIEVLDWVPGHVRGIERWLWRHRYALQHTSEWTGDLLYRLNPRWWLKDG